jgi:hypothetical protein
MGCVRTKKEFWVLIVCVIMINITPACAVNIGDMNTQLENLSKSKDINTINKWSSSGGWYRFWNFGGFCTAVHHLSSQTDGITKDVKALNSSLNETYNDLNNVNGFLENQKNLNTELTGYLKQKSNGESPASPASAVYDAKNVQIELTKNNKTIDVSVHENVKDPQKYDVVQLISDVSNVKGDHTLHYWFLKEVFQDADTKESMVKLYNGNSYVSMTYKTFKQRFTGVVLDVNDIKQSNINVNGSNLNGNQTANHQALTENLINKNISTNDSSNIAPANKSVNMVNKTNNTANNTDLANSAALCDIVDAIYNLKTNNLSTLLSMIPAYDYDLVKILTTISAAFSIFGTIIWVIGGILCSFPPSLAWGVGLCIFGGLLCAAASVMLIFTLYMHDSRDDSATISDILENVNSHSIT